jgi:putative transposase
VGKKTGPNPTDRAKLGTKRSLLTDGDGVPLSLAVSGANTHDIKLLEETLGGLIIIPAKKIEQHLCADKAYDSEKAREEIQNLGYEDHIRSRGEKKIAKMKNGTKARRWVVERTHSWFNRYRRLFIRWEKKSKNYEALLHFACAVVAFRAAEVLG